MGGADADRGCVDVVACSGLNTFCGVTGGPALMDDPFFWAAAGCFVVAFVLGTVEIWRHWR